MSTDTVFEDRATYVAAEYSGRMVYHALPELVASVMAYCESTGHERVLLDVTKTTDELSVIDRWRAGLLMACSWRRDIRLAVLGRPDQLLPDRFFETVTRNRGLSTGVFTDPSEAVGWLTTD